MKNNEQQNEALKQLTNVLTEAGNQTRVDVLAHSILLQAIFSVLSEEQKIKLLKSFRPLPLINMLRPQALKQK